MGGGFPFFPLKGKGCLTRSRTWTAGCLARHKPLGAPLSRQPDLRPLPTRPVRCVWAKLPSTETLFAGRVPGQVPTGRLIASKVQREKVFTYSHMRLEGLSMFFSFEKKNTSLYLGRSWGSRDSGSPFARRVSRVVASTTLRVKLLFGQSIDFEKSIIFSKRHQTCFIARTDSFRIHKFACLEKR